MEILQAQTCCKARLDWPGGSSLRPSYPKIIQDSSETLWDLGVKGGPPFACKFHLNNCGSSAHRNPCCSKSNSSYFVKNAARNLPKRFGQVFGEVTSWTNQGARDGGTQVASEGVCKWLHVLFKTLAHEATKFSCQDASHLAGAEGHSEGSCKLMMQTAHICEGLGGPDVSRVQPHLVVCGSVSCFLMFSDVAYSCLTCSALKFLCPSRPATVPNTRLQDPWKKVLRACQAARKNNSNRQIVCDPCKQ